MAKLRPDTLTVRSPNIGGNLKDPRFVVCHYTVSGDLEGTVRWLSDKRARASAHIVIGRDGALASVIPLDRVAWHAGKSSWKGQSNLNHCSIGIELVNWGPLRAHPTLPGKFTPVSANAVVDSEDVFHGRHKSGTTAYDHWQSYPDTQLSALDKLLGELFHDFPSLIEVVGHDDVSPGRKSDPGPAFDSHMKEFQKKFNRY